MKDFMNIGLGLAINKNKFYVVTQYGQQVIPTGDVSDTKNLVAKK